MVDLTNLDHASRVRPSLDLNRFTPSRYYIFKKFTRTKLVKLLTSRVSGGAVFGSKLVQGHWRRNV